MNRPQLLCILLLGLGGPAFAAGDGDAKPAASIADQASATQGSVTVGGKTIAYTADAGLLVLKDDKGEPTANMSYVAYLANGKDAASRPVMFIYNGGPGSSTIWLHMASFGPKRVVVGDHEHTPSPSYQLVDNPYSLLDATDLVFVDAPGTGFGRILDKDAGGKGEAKDFYGVDPDGKAFTQFIERFLTKYGRWNSPKYLFGESYGTPRSAVVSYDLQNDSVDLNGVILLSAILNFDLNADNPNTNPGVDLPYAVNLPTYAAAAWYHKKAGVGQDLPGFLHEVEGFAMGDYLAALQKGSELSDADKHQIAEKLHTYTSLPADYWVKADLRVVGPQFEQQLLLESGETTGRFDTRYSGPVIDPLAEFANYDPQSAAIGSPIVSVFNDYVRKGLKFGQDLVYLPVNNSPDVNNWDFKHAPPGQGQALPQTTNVMPDLAAAMSQNPQMKVLLNAGYFDLATPYYSAVYVMHHLPMVDSLQKNISYAFYPAGHMVYVNLESLKMLHDNVAKFIDSSHK
ncbi:MAG TPA: peptidase S10 [Gammaproteobacteria bacterium]|nr:peptidase S10 [Gammaproteobacteria bacterium]